MVCGHLFPLTCAVGHAAAFAVNAALVASQWQRRTWNAPVHPPINAEHETTSNVYQVFGMIRPVHNPAYHFRWRVLNQLYHLTG